MILSRHCIPGLKSIPDIDRYLSMHESGVFLQVKHAWYRLLRLLAAPVFHTVVTFQKKSGPGTITTGWIPNKLDSGFQWLDSGFHELDSGFQSHGFPIPQGKIAWIPDSGLPYLGRHFDEIQTLIQVNSFDIFLMTETWLNSTWGDNLINIDGYDIFHCDRKNRGGGAAIELSYV